MRYARSIDRSADKRWKFTPRSKLVPDDQQGTYDAAYGLYGTKSCFGIVT